MSKIKVNTGFITLQRQIIDWEWYDDVNTFRLFIHILLKANHTDKPYRGTLVKRGTFLTGLDVLSKETGLSIRKIRTSLERLKSTNELTIKTSTKGSVIQIVKYNDYQSATSKTTNERQTNDKRTTSTNNDNNDNNDNNSIDKQLTNKPITPKKEVVAVLDTTDDFDKYRKNYSMYAKKLYNTNSWIESISRMFIQDKSADVNIKTIDKYLRLFLTHLEGIREKHEKETDFTKHFSSWMRKQPSIVKVYPKQEEIRYF